MPLPQRISVNITPENVWALLDEVDSDLEDDLADVMEDSDTEFVVEDEEKDSVEEKIPEKNLDAGLTNEPLHAILIEQDTPKQPNDNGSIKSVINPDQRTSSNPQALILKQNLSRRSIGQNQKDTLQI